jgi:hypothetical protein
MPEQELRGQKYKSNVEWKKERLRRRRKKRKKERKKEEKKKMKGGVRASPEVEVIGVELRRR